MTEQKNQKGKAAGLGVIGVLAAFLFKFKVAIFSALKFGWLLKASWTMILSFGIYAALYGWRWALIVVGLIFIHEMGHYIYMKAKGLDPKLPVFIPFMGAYVAMTKLPEDPVVHAWVAISGPLAGGLASAALYVFGAHSGNNLLVSAAAWGFIINLLQLVPVRPFDGGFIAECISKWLAIPGILALIYVTIQWKSPILTVISVMSVFSTIKRFRQGGAFEVAIPMAERFQITTLYFGLAWALASCYWHAEEQLRPILGQ